MEQEEEEVVVDNRWPAGGDRRAHETRDRSKLSNLSLGCQRVAFSRERSSKMPFAFTTDATTRRQTHRAAGRPSWPAKLLILGLVALAWDELFPGPPPSRSGRIDLYRPARYERLRQLAHCPLAVCPAALVGEEAEISDAANRFRPPLLVFAAATAAPDQSLNTSASGGVQPNNNNNNETTRAAAASDLLAKVAGDAATAARHLDQQQQLKKVDLNSSPTSAMSPTTTTTTAGGSDLPLIIMTKQQQQQEQQQQQGDLTGKMSGGGATTSVVCNSRCRCVQLELAGAGPDERKQSVDGDGPLWRARGGQQRARDKMLAEEAGGFSLAGWLGKLGGPSSSAAAAATSQIESMMSRTESENNNNNEIATGDTNSSAAAADMAKSNKIALIEFSQDYSFDELDEFSASLSGLELGGGGGGSAPDEQATNEQTTARTTALAGTGNENHHAGEATAAAASLSSAAVAEAGTQKLRQQAAGNGNGNAQPVAVSSPALVAAQTAIKHANDQSKVVDNSASKATLSVTAPSSSSTWSVSPALLSIKDNKTGTGQEKQQHSGDQGRPQQGTLYPHYLNIAHHNLHNAARQRHNKLMPAAFNQQMSAQFGGAAQPTHDFFEQQQQQDGERVTQVARILPLRSLNLTRGQLTTGHTEGTILQMLKDIQAQSVQSLSLGQNKLTFETWTQLYALLAVPLRRHIYHLDLSHNSLAKLGVTFTGYIEHHLAHQLVVQHNQSWPFSSSPTQNQSSYLQFKLTTSAQSLSTSAVASAESSINELHHQTTGARTRAHQKLLQQQQQLRHPNLGEGKLYNAVRSELPIELDSILVSQVSQNHQNETTDQPLAPVSHRKSQSGTKKMAQTILHQAARVKALDLSYNKLEWLINDQFRVLKHVESIRLDHNQIRYIHQQAFNGLEELKYLNLNYNRIQTIYMEQFQTNFNLRALFLQSNYLTYLRADSLAALDKLRRLDLSRNKFSLLSNNAFAGLDSLEFLNLSANQFVHVPSASFHSLAAASLRELDLSRNQLAQLMPGTFFHLKLERLWLDENPQLVAIDRGAFWDLPHLSELSLRSNQMLLNVNSQAFVGLPNIRTINYDECPFLDSDTKRMLDNVTLAATVRHLIQVKPQPGPAESGPQLANVNVDSSSAAVAGTAPARQSTHEHMRLEMGRPLDLHGMLAAAEAAEPGGGGGPRDGQANEQLKWAMKYVYSAGCLVFIVIALKLVFSFTSTSHRLSEGRRRRRRVYQASVSSLSSDPDDSLSSSSSSSSSAVNYCDELAPPPDCIGGFAMCEQRPQGLLAPSGTQPAPSQLDRQPTPSSESTDTGEATLDVQVVPHEQQEEEEASNACCDLVHQAQVQVSAECTCPDCCAQAGQQQVVIVSEGANLQANEATYQGNSCCDISTTTATSTNLDETMPMASTTTGATGGNDEQAGTSQHDSVAMELIHDQLVAAGYGDYGHAKCAHFYQSLGPALQLADLTASLVNQMDYYS